MTRKTQFDKMRSNRDRMGGHARDEARDIQAQGSEWGSESGEIEPGASPQIAAFGWPDEPGVGRMVDGVANRPDRIKAIGNGQVPRVAATAWRMLGGP